MATATEIVTRALKRLRRTDSNATPDAVDVADGTEALTAMLASWEGDGLSGDVLPLDSRFEQAVVAMLAVRMSEDFGVTPGPVLLRDADNGWKSIQGAYFAVPETRFEFGMLYQTGPGAWPGALASNDVVIAEDWEANTTYGLRSFVVNGANLYELVTAGTSASSGGPTGTDAEITDGTCVWCWRRVTAS